VSDGTAVLGLGDIGPRAAMPVMEGKAMLFKEFAGVDAFPICLDTTDVDEIVAVVKAIAPTFGGINLEDISAPRCFEIESRLQAELDIPVFHDDQHGTAVVVLAALLNALTLTGQRIGDIRVVVVGLGAAGVAVSDILLAAGVRHLIGCDSRGAVHTEREDYLSGAMGSVKRELAQRTNLDRRSGGPGDVIEGADLFIGLSGGRVLPASALQRMNPDPIVFAMANPDPEVDPNEAAQHAAVVATGRSDFPNQINNVLAFPGVFRGLLDARSTSIEDDVLLAAAQALAAVVSDEELNAAYIVPSVFHPDVTKAVASAVQQATTRARERAAAGPSPLPSDLSSDLSSELSAG
jgi:malate dehydrogenase (oxaloacetate-decarboxylating)